MKYILPACLGMLLLEANQAAASPSTRAQDAAIELLLDSVNLELTDYIELQPNQDIETDVDGAEADFLLEERLSQFSDELQLESELSLDKASLSIETDDEDVNAENIAPSRALSVRYLGSESIQARSTNPTDTLFNPSIMGIESDDIVPVDLSGSNSPALTDYSRVENSKPLLRPEGGSTVSTQSLALQAPESSYAAQSTSSTSYSTSGGGAVGGSTGSGGGGAITYQSTTEGSADGSGEDGSGGYNINIPFIVDGRVLINAAASTGMIFTIEDEQAAVDPLPPNFNIQIDGYDITTPEGVVEQPALDGQGLYSGLQMLYTSSYNNSPTITINKLHSMENFTKTLAGDAVGGAINMINGKSEIIFENDSSPVTFKNNHVTSTANGAAGGAIFLSGGASVGDLKANFINNSSSTPNAKGSGTYYSRGGAIAVGITDEYTSGYKPVGTSSIGTITGDFTDNKAAFGGAIYLGGGSSVGSITGNFERNIAEGYKQSNHTSGADGGAIRAFGGEFGSIDGDFTDNVAYAFTGEAIGGAVSLREASVSGVITGVYTGNIVYSATSAAMGGGYSLRDQTNDEPIQLTDVSFYNNVAVTGSNIANNARGAAIYISNSQGITITAENEDVEISNNYTLINSSVTKTTSGTDGEQWNYNIVEGSGVERDYTAIYLDKSNLTLETTAGSDKTITIDDGIVASPTSTNSTITVRDNSHSNIENEYGVFLNGELGMNQLIVETGGVQLGSATHSDGSTTTGSFVDHANLTIMETGRVKTNADYLKNVGTVDLQGVDRNTAALINFTGGKLVSDINPDGARHGHVAITGATIFGVDPDQPTDKTIVNADTISVLNTLELMEATTVNANTLFFYGYDEADVNTTNHIVASPDTVFSFSEIELNFATANPGDIFEIIVSDGTGQLTIDYDFSKTVVFTVDGQTLEQGEDKDFIVRRRDDGGIEVEILIHVPPPPPVPEPSTATLSLIALASFLRRRRRRIQQKSHDK